MMFNLNRFKQGNKSFIAMRFRTCSKLAAGSTRRPWIDAEPIRNRIICTEMLQGPLHWVPKIIVSLVFQLSPLGSIRESLQSPLKITTGGQISVPALLSVFNFSKVWNRFVTRWVNQYRQNWRIIAIKIIFITIDSNSLFVDAIAIYKNVQIYW